MKKIQNLILLIVAILGFALCNSVSATTISPVKIEASLDPGQAGRYSMVLFNETKSDLYLEGSVELFEPKGDSGQAQLKPGDVNKTLPWVKLPTPSLVLKPGEYKNVPLILEIPKGAPVGGYYYAIMWQSVSDPIKEPSQVGISSRVGCLVLLDVQGVKNEKLQITDFKLNSGNKVYNGLPVSFVSHLENSGDTHLKPKGSIILQNFLGQVVDVIPFNDKGLNILPKSTRKFDLTWSKKGNYLLIGPFTALLSVEYGDSKIRIESEKINFWVIPWNLVIWIIVILFILIIFTYFIKRKKK